MFLQECSTCFNAACCPKVTACEADEACKAACLPADPSTFDKTTCCATGYTIWADVASCMSTNCATSRTRDTGVPGLMATPAPTPRALVASIA